MPLFAGTGTILSGLSKNPSHETGTENTRELNISDIVLLSWTITAMSGSESVAITGVGDISSSTSGNIRIKAIQCYRYDGSTVPPVNNSCRPDDIHQRNPTTGAYTATGEELQYAYDISDTIANFLTRKKDPYVVLYNPSTTARDIIFSSSTPFSLPTLTVRSTANM